MDAENSDIIIVHGRVALHARSDVRIDRDLHPEGMQEARIPERAAMLADAQLMLDVIAAVSVSCERLAWTWSASFVFVKVLQP